VGPVSGTHTTASMPALVSKRGVPGLQPSADVFSSKAVPAELDVHVVCDDYATHNTAEIKTWLGRNAGSAC
jgi:hypothetical protein